VFSIISSRILRIDNRIFFVPSISENSMKPTIKAVTDDLRRSGEGGGGTDNGKDGNSREFHFCKKILLAIGIVRKERNIHFTSTWIHELTS
jgi:hypothetical protein